MPYRQSRGTTPVGAELGTRGRGAAAESVLHEVPICVNGALVRDMGKALHQGGRARRHAVFGNVEEALVRRLLLVRWIPVALGIELAPAVRVAVDVRDHRE